MLLREIINFLDNLYPINTSLSWDNSGLQVGNLQDKIHSILISLSITGDTINYAKQNGCNLIIAHHPLIFESIKCLDL